MSATASGSRMAAVDAQLLWLSATLPNDQYLLYAFGGAPDVGAGLREMRRRARDHPQLAVRVRDDRRWRYPRWVPAAIEESQFVVHGDGVPLTLPGPLDATRCTWRIHVFPPATVVVQISHALGDGTRSAALAAALLGRPGPVPAIPAPDRGLLPVRALRAARAHRDLPPPQPPRPALSVNAAPRGTPVSASLVVPRDRLRAPTVTVGALSVIAEALGGYLGSRGEDTGRLAAEVPVSTGIGNACNNFRNVTVGLHPGLSSADRAARIAAELEAGIRRTRHPAQTAADAAFAVTPAWLLRWGVGRFEPQVRSATVAGNTVVSSVHRGAADLSFGGRPVRHTAGFPALSPMQSLTHGVHGIGDTVAVSVLADPLNVDIEDYLDRLKHALGCFA